MDTLENYLASDYLAETQEIATIDRTLSDVAAMFCETFDSQSKGWPYEFRTDGSVKPPPFGVSQGTLAMVLTATGRMVGHCSLTKGTFATPKNIEKIDDLKINWGIGFDRLLKDLADTTKKAKVRSSFGDNNPLTLSHLSELYRHLKPSDFGTKRNDLHAHLEDAKKRLRYLLKKDLPKDLLTPKKNTGRYYPNAFVPLRALRAASDFGLPSSFKTFFESTLHDHLSFSSIPDSRFDPAELLFCLEGLLLCAPEAVDASLFDRVLEVLAEKQNTSAYWRPNKPFIASSRGAILLPVSVEGANSLMRSIVMMDANLLYDTFTAKGLPLIQRFWHWLRARSVRFEHGEQQCIGWHSEHVNDPNLIHTWDTSQVVEFMIYFREMLERHIAIKSLRLSRLDVKRPQPNKDQAKDRQVTRWKNTIKKFEPMLGTRNEDKQIYTQLESDFVIPWASGKPNNFSMLLFGPPGTGKSTVAENIAEVLEMPLITVTVSDFLGTGGANVEARAKAIFQTLEAQDRCVILFDEIDSFLLDRDSERYRKQDSLFQFLTPGMLTKINDLRKRERSLFIIATNYADRIDPAIKRTGRIDKQYLLPLPNANRRIEIMKDRDLKRISKKNTPNLVKHSALFGYSDLKGAIQDAGGSEATIAKVLTSLKKSVPATSLNSYRARLGTEEKFPKEEFRGLIELCREAERNDMIDKMINKLNDNEKKLQGENGFSDLIS